MILFKKNHVTSPLTILVDAIISILFLNALGFLSNVACTAFSTISLCSTVLLQQEQLHPSQYCLLAKHSQYLYKTMIYVIIYIFLSI